ncbi:MAG: nickel-dependent hydrogenase large subunit [Desulfobulbaceae bacterium]|jgi:hydrogenase large subunit|nr:nickel-dependent hydrogenase large subunit [Desulfobulbaceae bacterium]
MAKRIVVDPITRIEGHLRIECEIENGHVSKAWSSGTMWRGIELILQGKDPREAWIYTQRICGVCTTVHAIASVRAVENALGLEIPMNAQHIRNIIIAAHSIFDHIVHFYHLSALDWVDIVSATKADAKAAAKLAETLSPWKHNSAREFQETQDRLKKFISTGQLGVFASGYWGHPAMKLTPEVNLMAANHYFQALDYQRKINKVVAILGSKTPHIQNLAVGGVANPINPDSQSTLTIERLVYIKSLIDEVGDFISDVYQIDVAAIGAMYADWTGYGEGITNYLSVPEFPQDTKGETFLTPGGYIPSKNLSKFVEIKSFHDPYFEDNITESIKHAYYKGESNLHPYKGETEPNFTGFEDDGKYSWVKAPTFLGKPAQVGPLANVLAMFAAGHPPTVDNATRVLNIASSIAGTTLGPEILHSTIGRHAARAVRCGVLHDVINKEYNSLIANIGSGDYDTFNAPVFPKGEIQGVGMHEAPRGVLSHWVIIKDGQIKNYQCVVPSTWNAGPRNDNDEPGPYEAALHGTPVADPENPLEVLRTIHSFDPCLACAIHLYDPNRTELTQVTTNV